VPDLLQDVRIVAIGRRPDVAPVGGVVQREDAKAPAAGCDRLVQLPGAPVDIDVFLKSPVDILAEGDEPGERFVVCLSNQEAVDHGLIHAAGELQAQNIDAALMEKREQLADHRGVLPDVVPLTQKHDVVFHKRVQHKLLRDDVVVPDKRLQIVFQRGVHRRQFGPGAAREQRAERKKG
jgi:hypothetical protein